MIIFVFIFIVIIIDLDRLGSECKPSCVFPYACRRCDIIVWLPFSNKFSRSVFPALTCRHILCACKHRGIEEPRGFGVPPVNSEVEGQIVNESGEPVAVGSPDYSKGKVRHSS